MVDRTISVIRIHFIKFRVLKLLPITAISADCYEIPVDYGNAAVSSSQRTRIRNHKKRATKLKKKEILLVSSLSVVESAAAAAAARSSTLAFPISVPPSLPISPHEPPNPRRHRRRCRSPLAHPHAVAGVPWPPIPPLPHAPRSRRSSGLPQWEAREDDERRRGTRTLALTLAAAPGPVADAAVRVEVLAGVRRAQRRRGGPGWYRSTPLTPLL
jgi:hypothetical protein